jgi:hypothetical protein
MESILGLLNSLKIRALDPDAFFIPEAEFIDSVRVLQPALKWG